MQNPYYDIISLIRSQRGQPEADIFSAQAALDEEGKIAVLIDGQAVEEDFWTLGDMEITEEDDGCVLLCRLFDRGIIILAKIAPL